MRQTLALPTGYATANSKRVVMLESMVEELQGAVKAQQYDIEDLQIQAKKLQPKKTTTRKRKTATRTTRHKKDIFDPFE